jgi:hypothetical protein
VAPPRLRTFPGCSSTTLTREATPPHGQRGFNQDKDDLREILEKVTGKLLTLDRALEPILPALLALLDVPVDDTAWQHSTLDSVASARSTR